MARKLPAMVVVIVVLGWPGSILAHALAGSGLNVVVIERGPWRDTATDFPPAFAPDELRYHIRHDLFLRPAQVTMTMRNKISQTALPIRSWGSFMPPNGVGGGGVHWNAETWRFLPSDFQMKTRIIERYGEKILPPDMTIQTCGETSLPRHGLTESGALHYHALAPPHYPSQYRCGAWEKGGNLRRQIQASGSPLERPPSRGYPPPPQKQPYGPTLFAQAAAELGY